MADELYDDTVERESESVFEIFSPDKLPLKLQNDKISVKFTMTILYNLDKDFKKGVSTTYLPIRNTL